MRKILLSVLIAIPVALAAAYGLLWYMQAQQLKANIERTVAAINAEQKIFTYDAIDVGGFPLALNVDITRPRFSAQMKPLMQNIMPLLQKDGLTPSEEQLLAAISQLPEWREDMTWAGHIRFGVNLFSDRYTVSMDGPLTQISTMGNSTMTLVASPAGPHSCSLWLKREGQWFSGPWNVARLSRDPALFLQDFRKVECTIAASRTTDDATKEIIYSAGEAAMSFSHDPRPDGAHAFTFAVNAPEQEAKPAFDNFVNRYLLMFGNVPGAPSPVNFSAYGKQQLALNVAVLTPPNFGQMGSGGPFRLTVQNMLLDNALYKQKGALDINNTVNGPSRDLTVQADFTTAFTAAYDQFLADYILKTVTQVKLSDDPSLAQVQAGLMPYQPAQVVDMLRPVTPHMSGFGDIVTRIDMHMQGDEALRKGDLNIKHMEIAATPYGVTLAGKAGMTGDAQGITPESRLTLTCRNCIQLVADAGGYAQRAEAVYNTFVPPTAGKPAPPPMVTPQLVEGVHAFIRALATEQKDAGGATLSVFELAGPSGTPGTMSINGKPMDQVMQLYAQLVAPHVPGGTTTSQPVVLQPMAK